MLVNKKLLTPGEVAQIFGVDPKTVTRWAASGRLRSIRTPGGHRRFYAEDIEQHFIDSSEPVAPTPQQESIDAMLRQRDEAFGMSRVSGDREDGDFGV